MVEVEWIDSVQDHGWHTADEVIASLGASSLAHRSVGYLLRDDKVGVLLVNSLADGFDSVGEPLLIPRVAVGSVTKLRR